MQSCHLLSFVVHFFCSFKHSDFLSNPVVLKPRCNYTNLNFIKVQLLKIASCRSQIAGMNLCQLLKKFENR